MSAEFGLVVHSSQGYPDIFPAQGLCHGLSEAGLANSGRTVEAEDGGLHIALQFQHGQIFDDPVLDRLETVMVIVEHLLSMPQVKIVLRHLAPGKVEHELDVVVLDAVVRRGRVVLLQFGKLFLKLGGHRFGPLLVLRPCAELFEFFLLVHPEFLLDGAQLVVEVIFPLLLVDVALDLLVDLLLDFEQLDLGVQGGQEFHCTGLHVVVP